MNKMKPMLARNMRTKKHCICARGNLIQHEQPQLEHTRNHMVSMNGEHVTHTHMHLSMPH